MTPLWTHPLLLRVLYAQAMGKAFLRYRDPRRRASGKHQAEFYQTMWRQAAEELGATCARLSDEISEIMLNGLRTRVVHNVSEIDNPVTLALLHDKPLTHQLLGANNLPVPGHAAFTLKDMDAGVSFLKSVGRDCVVKPAGGTGGGRGVTTGVRTIGHLARAAAAAAVYDDEILIEEQIAGDNYRLLYLDGNLIDSFVRRPPRVVGNGKSTVAALLRQINEERLASKTGVSQVLLAIDLDMRRTLAGQGLSLRSVPAKGRAVTLKNVVNENAAADNTTATHLLCPSIIEDGAKAVRALGARFAGIDIVTRDPSVPLMQSGGVILEVNGTPNLYYHYKKSDGCFPAALYVLRRLLLEPGESSLAGKPSRPAVELETANA